MSVFVELSSDGKRAEVYFSYSTATKDAVKSIPGAKFVSAEKGGPFWTLPLELTALRSLRQKFGSDLELGNAIKRWGQVEVRKERNLQTLAKVDDVADGKLKLDTKLPKLAEWLRPYQRADVKILATGVGLNLNEQRLGKTPEIIGTIYEADLEGGPHLIVAQKSALDSVWRMEFERWTDLPVFTYWGEVSKKAREAILTNVRDLISDAEPFVFCTTADMVRRGLPEPLDKLTWNTFTIDEYHKTGLPEPKNKFSIAADHIHAKRRFGMTGTPMGGKPIKLWGGLRFTNPNQFTSKWRWAGNWLVIEEKVIGRGRTAKEIKGIKPGMEAQFYQAHAPYMLRRLRTEVLPQLPETQIIDVWCNMTPTQKKQYNSFAADTEIRIDGQHLSAQSILAEYVRLKVFAFSHVLEMEERSGRCDKCKGSGSIGEDEQCPKCEGTGTYRWLKLIPSYDSGKLDPLLDRLAEQGIDPNDPEGDSQAVVASQFTEVVDVVTDFLNDKGISAEKITGKVSGRDRTLLQERFQSGTGPRVIVLNTLAGGTSITLNRASSIHILDETWNPDDQAQVQDRILDTVNIRNIGAFYYRMRGTIEEDIYAVTEGKQDVNREILDRIRQRMRSR